MYSQINKVCVVTNFRTASTSFTLLKADMYKLPYKAELFSHEKPSALGSIPSRGELVANMRALKYADLIQSDANLLFELKYKNTPACFKIMPSHFKNTHKDHTEIMHEVLASVDKIYYLYRRDFISQVKSWIVVRRYGDFDKTGFRVDASSHEPDRRLRETHLGLLGNYETHKVTIDPKCRELNGDFGEITIPNLRDQLADNYLQMAKLYKMFPGELVCSEDYFSGKRYNPYNREITWTEEPEIKDLDVEKLFDI